MSKIVLIAHNLRSTHNVGSLLRTADGLGVKAVYLTGYTPYPLAPNDQRLPHLSNKINQQITKTALGAETSQVWEYAEDVYNVINKLRSQGYRICALEQSPRAVSLHTFMPSKKIAVIVGREVEGIEPELQDTCDDHIMIPMVGKKESFNVVQAAAMALYQLTFNDRK